MEYEMILNADALYDPKDMSVREELGLYRGSVVLTADGYLAQLGNANMTWWEIFDRDDLSYLDDESELGPESFPLTIVKRAPSGKAIAYRNGRPRYVAVVDNSMFLNRAFVEWKDRESGGSSSLSEGAL
jgi:hypothetical protein